MGNIFGLGAHEEIVGAMVGAVVGEEVLDQGPIGAAAVAAATVVLHQLVTFKTEDFEYRIGRLQSLADRIRFLTKSIDRDDLEDAQLLRWYDRLLHEADKGEELVNIAKSQQTDSGPAGNFTVTSRLVKLLSRTATVSKLENAIERIEKECADIGIFIAEVGKIIGRPRKRRRMRR